MYVALPRTVPGVEQRARSPREAKLPQISLAERISLGPIVLDGAMGTQLYQRGQFINKPLESANLTSPDLVSAVHREYVSAGADAIETNTFAANEIKLQRAGLADDHDRINLAAVRIAQEAAGDDVYVLGAIGPSGSLWSALTEEERSSVTAAHLRQAQVLIDAGVDGIVLETFGWADELYAALDAIRKVSDLPVFAFASFTSGQLTADGADPASVARALKRRGASVIGANCSDGPQQLFETAGQMVPYGLPVGIVPNAGYPKNVDGRLIYMATPEYFGVYARRMLKVGVAVIGGCCGTSPDHIRSLRAASNMAGGSAAAVSQASAAGPETREIDVIRDPIPFAERSGLAAKIAGDEGFVVSVEVNPPPGLDASKSIAAARMLKAAGVDVINIADGPRASARMSNWSLSLQVRREVEMDSIVHVCSRDRNLLGLQSDLLAYHMMGIRNVVIITGDPPKMGDYPHATAVFDLDSIGTITMASQLNRGIDPAGRDIGARTQFAIACGAEPAALDYDREIRRLERKINAGASYIMTQPVYDPAVLDRFLTDIEGFGVPVLVGLVPLASHRNAEFLHNEIPGMQIPAAIRARMESVGSGPDARSEGVRIAQEMLLAVKDRVRGAYIMPPFGRYEAAIEILQCVGYEIPDAYRENWRA